MAKLQEQLEETMRLAFNRTPPPGPASERLGPLAGRKKDDRAYQLAVARLRPDADQVRKSGKDAADPATVELAESIRRYGILKPLDVRWIADADRYEIVDGERRYIAATQLVGLAEVPVRVVERSDDEIVFLQLTEPSHKLPLAPLDLATAIGRVMERGLSLAQVAKRLDKSLTWVQKALTVAKGVSPEARPAASKLRSMDKLYDVAQVPAAEQSELALRIEDEKLTLDEVREVTAEGKVRQRAQSKQPRSGRPTQYREQLLTSGGITITLAASRTRVTSEEKAAALTEALKQVKTGKRAA